jgi:hypothetical protein
MRLGDLVLVVPPGAGTALMAVQDQWLSALVVLGAASIVSLIVWDVRRAGGLGAWAQGLLPAVEGWVAFVDRRSRRRATRRSRRRRERQKRREIKRDGRRLRDRG